MVNGNGTLGIRVFPTVSEERVLIRWKRLLVLGSALFTRRGYCCCETKKTQKGIVSRPGRIGRVEWVLPQDW